jgi:hypothetical protein
VKKHHNTNNQTTQIFIMMCRDVHIIAPKNLSGKYFDSKRPDLLTISEFSTSLLINIIGNSLVKNKKNSLFLILLSFL